MNTTRRGFLCLSAAAPFSFSPIALSTAVETSELQRVSRTSWALGSEVCITALHRDRATAKKAVDAAFTELATVERLMSIYRDDSELCRLNRDGVLRKPHPYFTEVLRAAQSVSRRTNGAFDVTVQPLWALYANEKKHGRVPDEQAITVAQRSVDWRQVDVTNELISLRGKNTASTLNGIAQGYAADRANAALKAHGVEHALIDTGEFSTLGNKESGGAWKIGIQHPRVADAYISIAKLAGRCLATSGDYATDFTADHQLNHLFDPGTGRSPTELASVSICANTAMQADSLSTATFVLGVDRGMRLVSRTPGADALMVLKNGQTFVTRNFPVDA